MYLANCLSFEKRKLERKNLIMKRTDNQFFYIHYKKNGH